MTHDSKLTTDTINKSEAPSLAGGKPAGLSEVAPCFLERALFGFLARGSVGAREPRAWIHVRNRAVIHVAELVRLDGDRPTGQVHLPARVVFGLHLSTGTPTRLPHSVHDPS